jgi:hypothetical protein
MAYLYQTIVDTKAEFDIVLLSEEAAGQESPDGAETVDRDSPHGVVDLELPDQGVPETGDDRAH